MPRSVFSTVLPLRSILAAAVVIIALAVRLLALVHYGLNLTLHSDDQGYTQSAIRLLELGRITYHTANEHTVHMMPGITLLLAGVFAVFGWHATGLYAAKTVMILIGTLAVYAVYRLGAEVWTPWVGAVAALAVAVYPPIILTDTLLLTEPPFTASFLFLVLFTIQLAKRPSWKLFAWAVACFLIALMFRPTVALYPVVIAFYLLIRKFPLRLLWRQALSGALIVALVLSPWWIRNYYYYHKFIPLTAGSGDPLLLGTYQGVGYPRQPTYDQVLQVIRSDHPGVTPYQMAQFEDKAALQRMSAWWHNDPWSMLRSYLLIKPVILWKDAFYWIPIFHISKQLIHSLQGVVSLVGFAGLLAALAAGRSIRREVLFILLTLAYYTGLYSVYFAYGRYSEPLLPLVFLGAIGGLCTVVRRFRRTTARPAGQGTA